MGRKILTESSRKKYFTFFITLRFWVSKLMQREAIRVNKWLLQCYVSVNYNAVSIVMLSKLYQMMKLLCCAIFLTSFSKICCLNQNYLNMCINCKFIFKSSFSFLLMLFFYVDSSAQTIRGKVMDANTGEPLVGATVKLEGTKYATIVRLDGTFAFTKIAAGTRYQDHAPNKVPCSGRSG